MLALPADRCPVRVFLNVTGPPVGRLAAIGGGAGSVDAHQFVVESCRARVVGVDFDVAGEPRRQLNVNDLFRRRERN